MDPELELLNILVRHRLVSAADAENVRKAAADRKLSVLSYLLQEKRVTEVSVLPALGEFYHLPSIEVGMLEIDEALVRHFSFSLLRRRKLLPVAIDESGVLLVAVGKPLDMTAMSIISVFRTGPVDYLLVPPSQIDTYLDSLAAVASTSNAVGELNRVKLEEDARRLASRAQVTSSETDIMNAPAVRMVDSLIREAVPFRASDIHIEPFERSVRVRYRIDGELMERASFPIESYPAISARIKILSGMNIAERRVPQDGRINMNVGKMNYDFRVSTLPTVTGEKFVIRVLDKRAFEFTREELGFSPEANVLVDRILAHPHGIVLMTGPTGCGKTTTLYTFLRELNRPGTNIVTVEDPVEAAIEGINQVQVNPKASLTFASAIRSILRQDPNIIMIGEIRDEETARSAIRAAITGRLVFSTLHTNDAPGAVLRLIDMGVDNYLAADSLVGVISQRLVKKLCPACRQKALSNPRETAMLRLTEPREIWQPCGCQFCNGTGYKGRVAIQEIMYLNDELRNIINNMTSVEVLREAAIRNGMVPMWEACREYVYRGITSLSELMALYME